MKSMFATSCTVSQRLADCTACHVLALPSVQCKFIRSLMHSFNLRLLLESHTYSSEKRCVYIPVAAASATAMKYVELGSDSPD